ncbi:MAG TPA: phospholipase [Oscillatoriaceae cyanobacterium M33_DOE_052]|uniref:phospholipase D n=1 Tax=Planktothricoides sp. SpSt-374 TaxID=2282167 RepID=A0A7C3ZJ16_9CYAN|nr:phospholipase [Oscillatoriaceae cyanobacterium M33_DOE_052]
MSAFHQLSRPALLNLAAALESGRITAPFLPLHLSSYVPSSLAPDIASELEQLGVMGMTNQHIAYTLRLLAEERKSFQESKNRVNLVWTGCEVPGSETRDTAVVVQELFNSAQSSVLIASYAIDKGKKAQELFGILARRLDALPNLQVRMFLNIQRPFKSDTSEAVLIKEFAQQFQNEIWPGHRLPEVFYYPESLAKTTKSLTCLHAKCLIIDEERLFITSANFTEAAHQRNIEAGVVMVDAVAAKAVSRQFETLVSRNILRSLYSK